MERGVSPSGTAAHTRAGVVLSSVRAAARGRNLGGSLSPAIELDSFINSHPLGRFQVRIALFCAAVLFLDSFDSAALGYIAPALAEVWHLPRGALGPVFASGFLGQLIGAVVAGPVADRIGRKSVIVAACVAFGLGALATTQASSLSTLLCLRLLTGLGLGAALPNAVALTTEYSPVAHRSRMLVLVFCGITLGSVAAGLIAARLLPVFGWTAVFWVGGAVPLTHGGRPGPDPGRGDRYTAHQSSRPGRRPCRACPQGGPSRHASPRGCRSALGRPGRCPRGPVRR